MARINNEDNFGAKSSTEKKLSKAELDAINEKAINEKKASEKAKLNKAIQRELTNKKNNENLLAKAYKNNGGKAPTFNGMYLSPEAEIKKSEASLTYLEEKKKMQENPELMDLKKAEQEKVALAKRDETFAETKDIVQVGLTKKNEIIKDDLRERSDVSDFQFANRQEPAFPDVREAKKDNKNPFSG